MNKLEAVKTVAGLVVSLGVGAVVGNVIKATTPEDLKTYSKVLVGVGSFALAGYFSMQAAKQTEESIQGLADEASKLINGEIRIEVVPETPTEE